MSDSKEGTGQSAAQADWLRHGHTKKLAKEHVQSSMNALETLLNRARNSSDVHVVAAYHTYNHHKQLAVLFNAQVREEGEPYP
jgi:hypothetical protein